MKRFFYVTMAVIAILFGVIYYIAPLNTDDEWYLWGTKNLSSSLQAFAVAWQNICRHLTFDTGRLSNIVAVPFLTVVPYWLYAVSQAFMVWATFMLTMRLAGPTSRLYQWLGLAALVFILPWYDSMISVMFSFNYVWSGAAMLHTIYFFMQTVTGRKYSPLATVAIALIALLAGWFHEGFALPMLAAMGVAGLYVRFRAPWRAWVIAFSVAAGLGILLSFPAVWVRNSQFVNILSVVPFREAVFNVVVFNIAFYIFAVSLAITLISPKLRGRFNALCRSRKLLVWMCAAGAATSFFILCMRYLGPRIAWPEILFSTVACMILWQIWWPRPLRGLSVGVAAAVAVLSVGNLLFAVRMQSALRDEYYEILALYESSDNGTVFYDNIRPAPGPDLFKTSFRHFNADATIFNFSKYHCPDKQPLSLVPYDLKDMVWRDAPLAPSDSRARIYAGRIVVSGDTEIENNVLIMVCRKSRGWAKERIWVKDFTGSDGTPLRLVNLKLFSQLDTDTIVDVRL